MKLSSKLLFLGLAFAAIATKPVFSQNPVAPAIIRVANGDVTEVVLTRRATSGVSSVVGQASSLTANVRNGVQNLEISGIRGSGSRICFEIKSSNGFYSATFSSPRPRSPNARLVVQLPRVLQGGSRHGMFAIRAFLSENAACVAIGPNLNATWSNSPKSSERWLAIAAPTASSVSIQAGTEQPRRCIALSDGVEIARASTTEFQYLCPVSQLENCQKATSLFLLTMTVTGPAPPKAISVGPLC